MDDFVLRIATINLNENIKLIEKLFENTPGINSDLSESSQIYKIISTVGSDLKFYYLEISEELDSFNLNTRYLALSKLLFSFIKNRNFNFMLNDKIDENFYRKNIEKSNDLGFVNELVKSLNYFMTKFVEFPKDQLTIRKNKLIFFIKINILILFLILFFNRKKGEMILYIKNLGEDLEETILRLFKLSPTHKYIPNRVLMCLHYIYLKLITSEETGDFISTCRKIEKKDKFLNKGNLEKFLKPEVPKLFYDYERNNHYIEKFYRKNMLKRDKSETERTVIVNILKVLLSTTDNINNPNSGEYIKDYIPEIVLYHFFVNNRDPIFLDSSNSKLIEEKENFEISPKNYVDLLSNVSAQERELYFIIELINKVSLTATIICFYFNILKSLQKYDLIQYTVFAFHLIDSNGLLVFLKILHQDYKSIEQQFINIYDTDVISIQFGQLIEVILLYNLKLIFKICFKNDDFILKYLIECKMHIMLRKVLNNFNENEKIKRYCLKLYKCQLKFYDKTWRVENVNIITSIYLTLKIKPENEMIENFLKYDKRDKNSKDTSTDYFNFEELKKIHADYHLFNYSRFLNNSEEFEKYQNSVHQSLYANLYLKMWNQVEVPEEIKNCYSNLNL